MPNWGVRIMLAKWGRYARSGGPMGYPNMATMERARIGRGGGRDDAPMPIDIAFIDGIICEAPEKYKKVLIIYYSQTGGEDEKAFRADMDLSEFKDIREKAESYVAINM